MSVGRSRQATAARKAHRHQELHAKLQHDMDSIRFLAKVRAQIPQT